MLRTVTTFPIIDYSLMTGVENAIRLASKDHIMPYFGKLDTNDIREKPPGDIVTIADVETEAVLAERLVDLIPNSQIVGGDRQLRYRALETPHNQRTALDHRSA
jgi:fructose-1,6-bisphosphatase/inositol monophosphatase family enzyme